MRKGDMRRLRPLAWLTASLAWPATLQQLSLESMIQKSTEIVSGRVVSTATVMRGPVVYTCYRVAVASQWKGNNPKETEVCVPGGRFGGVVQTFSGAPKLDSGRQYLLFLWTPRGGLTQVVGLSQGVFELSSDAKGELVLRRGASHELMIDSSGKLVEDAPVSMRYREMVDRIRRTLAGVQ